ncbi:MAG: hypothetical protein J7K46_03710 [Bacteroidales bacterium]|nr:hypothetical protein [Bacteroidales bacterium]
MKIAIQTMDKEHVGENFGRARFFAIYDTVEKITTLLSNEEHFDAAHGVGIQSVALLSRAGIHRVITYQVGPKAKETLERTGIEIFTLPQDLKPVSIKEAIRIFLEGNQE